MKIANYEFPHSSFLSVQKDLELISNNILKNTRLQRLLHYTTPDALSKENLNEDEKYELFKRNIKIVPKLYIDGSVLNYIVISFDNFSNNFMNPEFRNNTISFHIICHFDQWKLNGQFQLRPYLIAAELDSMFNDKHLTGIGVLNFLSANQVFINEEFAGINLTYQIIHGEEDKKGMLNPEEEREFMAEFNQNFNV